MAYRSQYEQPIREELARAGQIGVEPRHVEAYMRLEHPTLDGLYREQFRKEVLLAVECIRVGGVEDAEDLARSFGLGA